MNFDGLMVLEPMADEPKNVTLFFNEGKDDYEKELNLGHFMLKLSRICGDGVYKDFVNLTTEHFADLYRSDIETIVENEMALFTKEITAI